MQRYLTTGSAFMLALLPAAALANGISSLTDTPQNFNGQSVTVRGVVANFHETPSQRGSAFATFSVCSNGCVRVYAPGNPKIANGQSVTVSGTFSSVDRINGYVYYNQIDSDAMSVHADNPVAPVSH